MLVRRIAVVAINLAAVAILTTLGLYLLRPPAPGMTAATGNPASAPGAPPGPASVRRGAAVLPPPPPAQSVVKQRLKELELENRTLSTQVDELGNWVLTNVRGTYPLPADMVTHLAMPAVSSNYSVHADLVRLLRMNETEQAMLNDALGYAQARMRKTEAPLVNVLARQENKVSLYVPPYEEDGQQTREDLMNAMEGSLGGARFDQLLNVSGKSLDEAFHYFGTAARTLEVELVPPQGAETAYLLIRDGWQIPDGESVTRWSGRETAARELPAEYADFRAWLPPAIAVYAR